MRQPRLSQSMETVYEQEHFVQFYQEDGVLLPNLKSFIGAGMVEGDFTLVIATPEHREALTALLGEGKLEVTGALKSKELVLLDAEETLARFMKDGLPDRNLFRGVINSLLEDATVKGKKVRAYGEMVALLWEQGNQAGAILLEQLWNEVIHDYALTLFCAYPLHYFEDAGHTSMLREISQLHSSAIAPRQSPSFASLAKIE